MKRARAIDEALGAGGNVAEVVGRPQNDAIGFEHLFLQLVHVVGYGAGRLSQTAIAAVAVFDVELRKLNQLGFGSFRLRFFKRKVQKIRRVLASAMASVDSDYFHQSTSFLGQHIHCIG